MKEESELIKKTNISTKYYPVEIQIVKNVALLLLKKRR